MTGNGKPYDELDYTEAQTIVRDCVCAQCWGQLISGISKGKDHKAYKVYCPECGEDRGFVSRDYVARKKAEDRLDGLEAKRNLASALGIEITPVDTEKAIKELYG